jgi:hypothetical protein
VVKSAGWEWRGNAYAALPGGSGAS